MAVYLLYIADSQLFVYFFWFFFVMCFFKKRNARLPDWTTSRKFGSGQFHCIHPSRKNTIYQRDKQAHYPNCQNIHSSWFLFWNFFLGISPIYQNCTHIHKVSHGHLQYKIQLKCFFFQPNFLPRLSFLTQKAPGLHSVNCGIVMFFVLFQHLRFFPTHPIVFITVLFSGSLKMSIKSKALTLKTPQRTEQANKVNFMM